MEEFNYQDFLSGVGIEKGDILDVASDLVSIMSYCKKQRLSFSPERLIDTLEDMVGAEGTVMIRAFTWDFCRGEGFDIQHSPSRVGALGNVAMKRDDFQRTRHPIYSWMVWGRHRDELCGMENVMSFGKGTPLDFLVKNDAKYVTVGNPSTRGMTLMHHVESLCQVPYRYEKVFEGEYIDALRKRSVRRYSMFVKPLNYSIEDIKDEKSTLFWDGMYSCVKWYDGSLSVKIASCPQIKEKGMEEILENDGATLFRFEGIPGYRASGVDWGMARYY